MTTVYYVRHAQPDLSCHDDRTRGLTSKGTADSHRIAGYFRRIDVDAIYSSPFKRALDTVRPLSDALGLSIRMCDDFRERKVSDFWIADFQRFSQKQWEDFDYHLPGGECLREVQLRNIAALKAVLSLHSGESIVIGGHGTALCTILHYYRPEFSYCDFKKVQPIMPCIIKFLFDGTLCRDIQFLPLA